MVCVEWDCMQVMSMNLRSLIAGLWKDASFWDRGTENQQDQRAWVGIFLVGE